jgi:hypothetical protein
VAEQKVIPEDLKETAHLLEHDHDYELPWQEALQLIERIGRAEAALVTAERTCSQLADGVVRQKAALEALRKPVTDEEWAMNSFQCEAEHVGKLMAERVDIDDIIAARSSDALIAARGREDQNAK